LLSSRLPSGTDAEQVSLMLPKGQHLEVERVRGKPSKSGSSSNLLPLIDGASDPYKMDKAAAQKAHRKYLEESRVDELFEEMVRELLTHQPAPGKDTRGFLSHYFTDPFENDALPLAQALGESSRTLENWVQKCQTRCQELESAATQYQESDLRTKLDALQAERNYWKEMAENRASAETDRDTAISEMNDVQEDLVLTHERLATTQDDLATANNNNDDLQNQVSMLNQRVEKLVGQLKREKEDCDVTVAKCKKDADELNKGLKNRLAYEIYQRKAAVQKGVELDHKFHASAKLLRENGLGGIDVGSDSDVGDGGDMGDFNDTAGGDSWMKDTQKTDKTDMTAKTDKTDEKSGQNLNDSTLVNPNSTLGSDDEDKKPLDPEKENAEGQQDDAGDGDDIKKTSVIIPKLDIEKAQKDQDGFSC